MPKGVIYRAKQQWLRSSGFWIFKMRMPYVYTDAPKPVGGLQVTFMVVDDFGQLQTSTLTRKVLKNEHH